MEDIHQFQILFKKEVFSKRSLIFYTMGLLLMLILSWSSLSTLDILMTTTLYSIIFLIIGSLITYLKLKKTSWADSN